jgi:hypothetical protein
VNTRLDQLVLTSTTGRRRGVGPTPALFALVETADPCRGQLAAELGLTDEVPGQPDAVDQGAARAPGLDELLGAIVWPVEVLGTALAVERLMVPPAVEHEMPQDESEALRWLAEHPERQEVRIVVAVLRDGSRASALRMRHDHEQSVLTGADLVPGWPTRCQRPDGLSAPVGLGGGAGRDLGVGVRAQRQRGSAESSESIRTRRSPGHGGDGLGAVAGRSEEHGAPARRAAIIFCVIPPIGPTFPLSSISSGAGDERSTGQGTGRQLVDDAQANISPALGPPTS